MPKNRILIVDDEEDIRNIVRATLSAHYEVIEAQDGLDALEKLELAEPDFVVLDVMMPLMDGFQTCTAIRRHPAFKDISVLFLSALNKKEDIVKGYASGANLFLTKPFDPQRLLRNVDMFFESAQPRPRPGRYSLDQVREFERQGPDAIAAARAARRPAGMPALAPERPGAAPPKPPMVPADTPAATDRSPTKPITIQTHIARVLLADDDAELLEVMKFALADNYEVATAINGIEAIEKVTSYQPDIIVLDALMPKMSGFQLCQSLRRNARYAKTPILFISGKTTPRDREYAMRIGATGFLAKPFDPAVELRQHIEAITRMPGFKVHPKALTYQALEALENRRLNQLEESRDRLSRKEESDLEKFLRENA